MELNASVTMTKLHDVSKEAEILNEEPHMETVELPGLQAEGEKLESTPLQTTPAELETHQLNLRHRTVEFTDAP
jgi:hypothetical protein